MVRLQRYILQNFSSIFFSLFIPLFSIASLIFFIKIVSITSVIKINFLELNQIYLYLLPQILFYTIPITFFAAAIMTLSKLSYDYEMVVIFSFGVSPKKVAKIFAKIATLATITLLILSLGIIPQAKQIYKSFINYKKKEAIFNIKPSEFGQKFGDWLLFLGEKKDKNSFNNIVLYNQKMMDKENFITANKAMIVSDKDGLKFILIDGSGYTYENEKLTKIEFKKMVINDLSTANVKHYRNIIEYWFESTINNKRAFDLTIFILVSLFPLISIFFILAFGIVNPRYEKNRAFFWIILSVVIFYALAFILSKKLPLYAIAIVAAIWLTVGYILYYKRVKKRY